MQQSPSSISDADWYRQMCARAVADDSFFDTFRQDPSYKEILEHVSRPQAEAYIAIVAQQSPHLIKYLELFRRNDLFGGAEVFPFEEPIGPFSFSTWRYIKVVSDLSAMFGDLRGFRIVEIGGGYGGQCAALSYLFPFCEYIIFDLPEVLELQRKYLRRIGVKNVAFLSAESLPQKIESDLVISNYALSEVVKPLAQRYLDACVVPAQRGYLTCNQIASYCYSREEFMARIPGAVAVSEFPLGHPDNYILAWRKPEASFSADPYRPVASVYNQA
jgi:putative sugar O-methyltransferase